MTHDQAILLAILSATIAAFLLGRWRHDMVAIGSLLLCVFAGLVPGEEAFAGFGHPAVITVACVLVLSRALQTSGAVDALARRVMPANAGFVATLATLTLLAAALSAFMNNVGALALLMPIAIQVAARHDIPPGRVLMPVAFGSLLGGMTTLIGTPPNLIVAGFRAQTGGDPFAMFDFAPVGIAVALAGLAFILLIGWRLVPDRQQTGVDVFEIDAYMTEARVPKDSKAVGKTLRELEAALVETDGLIVGMVRNDVRMTAPDRWRRLQEGDILVIEAEPKTLASALSSLGLVLEEDKPRKSEDNGEEVATGKSGKSNKALGEKDETTLLELVVLPNSTLIGRSAADIRLRDRFAINMLAVSRQGRRSRARLRTLTISAGDVLLMQGSSQRLSDFAAQFGLVPLAERALRIPNPREAVLAFAVMGAAIAVAASGLFSAAIAFAAGVLAVMVLRILPPRIVYTAVDWPVIVLLGALIPVAGAMASTGAADLIAETLLDFAARGNAVVALALILIVTMTLSDFMNNAATAAVMCPIAIGAARSLEASPDPFLMAVAVGASCAFLTPIGHQNSTLILGPGGFRFGDYWRLGLPLEIVVIAVAVPMLLLVWPM
ncbi:MAG: SLC13 family permease [Salinarimonadaceae bacterium]|nr:MAG: SLC13 family permease [Salinarimonadaceae bacterium]